MDQKQSALSLWHRLRNKPFGKWFFSKLICFKAPYFGSVKPRFIELRPGYCEVALKKRRSVHNHLGGVHAIAMCNLAEAAAGLMTDVSMPGTHRWIPKSMSVQYLKRAGTNLRAIAKVEPLPNFQEAMDLLVPVDVVDTDQQVVFQAQITMRVSPKKT
jgi:acyl-coenzyme A thioesterase PaaI-like protein